MVAWPSRPLLGSLRWQAWTAADLLKHLQGPWILFQDSLDLLASPQGRGFLSPSVPSQGLTRIRLAACSLWPEPWIFAVRVGPLSLSWLYRWLMFSPLSSGPNSHKPTLQGPSWDPGGREGLRTCTEPTICTESLTNYILGFALPQWLSGKEPTCNGDRF